MTEQTETVKVSEHLLGLLHREIRKGGEDGVTMTWLVRSARGVAPFRLASSKVRRAILNELIKEGVVEHHRRVTKGRYADLYVSVLPAAYPPEVEIEIVRVPGVEIEIVPVPSYPAPCTQRMAMLQVKTEREK